MTARVCRRRALTGPGGGLVLLALLPLVAPLSARADPADRDVEPAPPWVFFTEPDERTAREIDDQVAAFADLNQVVVARAALVRRFGVWSVPKLGRVLGAEALEARNETYTWNAELTAYALRDALGNAREIWPLVPLLSRLLQESAEPYRRAFAALGLGSFHSVSFAPPPPQRPDPLLVRIPEVEIRKHLEEALVALGNGIDDPHVHVRVGVALALGKSGAPSARRRLRAEARLATDAAVAPRQAVLLAVGLLPGQDDEDLLARALKDEQREIRRAAALAVALQALHDHPPGWTRAPRRMLRALTSESIRPHLEDGAEAVFARGVLAATGLAPAQWRELFTLAITPSTKDDSTRAAAQCLLLCTEPWFEDRALLRLTEGAKLKETVVAAFLLRLGAHASAEGVKLCKEYLDNRGRSPRGKPAWDVRYFAAVGLLRALAAGRVTDPALRATVLEALEGGVKKGLQQGPFRDALARVLELEKRRLVENPNYPLPEGRVLEVERSFKDPHGLLALDVRDLAVVRLNDMVPIVFNVSVVKPGTVGDRDKTLIPRRFLRACHENFPYFSRLDLRADRGLRPLPEMPRGSDAQREVRRR